MTKPSQMLPLPLALLADLRSRAELVRQGKNVRRDLLEPTEAAHALTGIISWITRQDGADAMRTACAAIVNHDEAWTTALARLPHQGGVVDKNVALLAVVCRGVIELAGASNLRAALAFWATESDPSEWQRLFAA